MKNALQCELLHTQDSTCIARVSVQRLHFIEKEALDVLKNEEKERGATLEILLGETPWMFSFHFQKL